MGELQTSQPYGKKQAVPRKFSEKSTIQQHLILPTCQSLDGSKSPADWKSGAIQTKCAYAHSYTRKAKAIASLLPKQPSLQVLVRSPSLNLALLLKHSYFSRLGLYDRISSASTALSRLLASIHCNIFVDFLVVHSPTVSLSSWRMSR